MIHVARDVTERDKQAHIATFLKEIRVIVDAGWSTRSTMGGIILAAGGMLKVWSRRCETVCMSSAEAELHAICEGLKEGLASAILLQSICEGLPEKDEFGIFKTVSGKYRIRIHTDSESALCISNMSGALRKVRHVELRHLLAQNIPTRVEL